MSDTYGASVIPVNVEQLRESDITYIFTELLMSFPVTSIYFEIPKWLEVVDDDNEIKSSVICDAAQIMAAADSLRISIIWTTLRMNMSRDISVPT